MGLDINYARNVRRAEGGTPNVHIYDSFKEQADGLTTGRYDADTWEHFRAGSYSGYGEFRRALCRAILGVEPQRVWEEQEAFKGRPFFNLINFSDCEGVIGPLTASKLADDFADPQHRAKFETQMKDHADRDYYLQKYDEWAEAFKVAADNGMVIFA
jgi:hypothetical protein